ncbi:hypothetical protein R3P38DRAFT_1191164 [Favolaschia claudopus]|uniref:Uncharacterized protein n=1 Tax=Favolaschia claudopus TaxID=2862362 RepID=A0AAW0DZ08_9AGAR
MSNDEHWQWLVESFSVLAVTPTKYIPFCRSMSFAEAALTLLVVPLLTSMTNPKSSPTFLMRHRCLSTKQFSFAARVQEADPGRIRRCISRSAANPDFPFKITLEAPSPSPSHTPRLSPLPYTANGPLHRVFSCDEFPTHRPSFKTHTLTGHAPFPSTPQSRLRFRALVVGGLHLFESEIRFRSIPGGSGSNEQQCTQLLSPL